jgi:ATP-dependent Clp protease ATP-binding subunit ClpB
MRLHFRPEFLNRLDDIVLFKPLTQAEIETRIGRALLSGDILDGAVIRIGYADGELTVGYDNPAYENAA